MNAETIAMALGGRKVGSAWMARCPAHEDREPSLSVVDAKSGIVLVRCHAGCDQHAVITALRSRGLWKSPGRWEGRFARKIRHQHLDNPDPEPLKRSNDALRVWESSQPAEGTQVATYLRLRGLNLLLPTALRFHAGLRHRSGGIWPTMVSLVTRGTDGTPMAIHRTFLRRDGRGKAPVDMAKMMLGPCGGGVVRLALPGDVLMVGEGIETCLAAMQATGHAAWAALSTSGLRALDLPRDVCDVIVLADGDEPGRDAAQDCACRWKRQGRRVRIAHPPQGLDFNDLLVASTASTKEDA